MDVISSIMLVFVLAGLIDRLFGNRLGLGAEFEKGLNLCGTLILTMAGMIVLAPLLADILSPVFNFIYVRLGIDPSILTSSLFANDMGGAQLAKAVAKDEGTGLFNGLVVGSMMGATVSFSIPFALGTVGKARQKELTLGLLCGIVTIPAGCAAGALLSGIPLAAALINLIPLTVFAIIISLCLIFFPKGCIIGFRVFGAIIKVIISAGLALGLIQYLTGYAVVKGLGTFEDGAAICLKCAVALAGAFPALHIIFKLFSKPLHALGRKLKINEKSTLGLISSLASNVPTFKAMNEMDSKGAMLNAAFTVSASFLIADHLAFTLAFDDRYIGQMLLSKTVAGVLAILFASLVYKKVGKLVLADGAEND